MGIYFALSFLIVALFEWMNVVILIQILKSIQIILVIKDEIIVLICQKFWDWVHNISKQ